MDRIRRRLLRIHLSSIKTAPIAVLLLTSALLGAPSELVRVRNFGKISDEVYRGGAPSDEALRILQAKGVKLVIDLRESGRSTDLERQKVRGLGMDYVNIPFKPWAAPTPGQVRMVLCLLEQTGGPAFVHCRRGKDRTGTVIACYRIQHDGWSNARALEEADRRGMSRTEYGMRAFIRHFPAGNFSLLITAGTSKGCLATRP